MTVSANTFNNALPLGSTKRILTDLLAILQAQQEQITGITRYLSQSAPAGAAAMADLAMVDLDSPEIQTKLQLLANQIEGMST